MSSLKDLIRGRRNPVILDRRERFLFFPNSKVAQRSIVRGLLAPRVVVRKDDPAEWEARFERLDDDALRRTFKFTLVRNPFDRVVSAYAYLRDKCQRYEFNRFVVDILGTQGVDFDPHFDVQSDGLFDEGRLVVDHVGRFEALDESWRSIAERIDAPARLPHRGRSRRAVPYTGYFNPEARQVIERLYADDLRNFGYAFEDERSSSRGVRATVGEWLRRRSAT